MCRESISPLKTVLTISKGPPSALFRNHIMFFFVHIVELHIVQLLSVLLEADLNTRNAQVRELTSEKGGAPQKFLAPVGTKWTSERKNISLAYPDFDSWVKGGAAPWSNVNTNYVYDQAHNSNSVQLPLVMKARRTISTEGEQALWTGSQAYGTNCSLADMNATLDLDQFYPGDRLRFYGEGIGDEAWITVIIGDIKPYFIDSDFPNYYVDSNGTKVSRSNGCVEVLLDESGAALLNSKVSGGKVTFQVQGRNFTLTRICRVLFQ